MLRRRLMKSGVPEEVIDLGLPSGTLWAKGNIVKNGSKYKIGEETDDGAYFSWGNIVGYNEGEDYEFDKSTYIDTEGYSLKADIDPNDAAHDAALACLGSPWRMPTKEDFQELLDNTDTEWTTINGVEGRKLMKKTDHSVYIFFSSSAVWIHNNVKHLGTGHYWSSSYQDRNYAYDCTFYDERIRVQNYRSRETGYPIRAVQ